MICLAGKIVLHLSWHEPGFNPIEMMWSKLKAYLRKYKFRTVELFLAALSDLRCIVEPSDATGSFHRELCYTGLGGLLLDRFYSAEGGGLAGFQYPWEALDGIRGPGGSGGGTGRRDGAGGRGLAGEVGRMRTAGVPGRRGGG